MIFAFEVLVAGMIFILSFFWKFSVEHYNYIKGEYNIALIKKILALLAIPFIIYQIIMSAENKKIKRFNSYRIKE
jgi:uncharacterized membrane protein